MAYGTVDIHARLGRDVLRMAALTEAVKHNAGGPTQILAEADAFYHWLTGPHPVVRLILTAGAPVDKNTRAPSFGAFLTPRIENPVQIELPDTKDVTLRVKPVDAEGFAEPDTLTWTAVDSTGAASTAVTLTPSDDTLSCYVASGAPTNGIVVTATDPAGNTASATIDVLGGPVSSLAMTADDPVDKPAPATPSA